MSKPLVVLALILFAGPALAERLETSAGPVEATRMAEGLDTPWSLAFLPDGDWLVTERGGRLSRVTDDVVTPLDGVPDVWVNGQGGLFDVVVARDFDATAEVFLTYAEPRDGGAATALAVARLEGDRLMELRVIFRQEPAAAGGVHFGGRVVEAPDGTLFLTLGERGERDTARALDNHRGKVVRVRRDGTPPPDNPFVGVTGARPEIWSYGHRNPQGAALGSDGTLWLVEHGPRGGDEVNRPQPGADYGWPLVTHGEEYGGGPIGIGAEAEGVEPPLHVWVPSIAPSGLVVYSGRLWPDWTASLFTGSLKSDFLSRLPGADPEGDLGAEERLFEGVFTRIRDVREAPDGAIWFIAEGEGAVWRVTPAP